MHPGVPQVRREQHLLGLRRDQPLRPFERRVRQAKSRILPAVLQPLFVPEVLPGLLPGAERQVRQEPRAQQPNPLLQGVRVLHALQDVQPVLLLGGRGQAVRADRGRGDPGLRSLRVGLHLQDLRGLHPLDQQEPLRPARVRGRAVHVLLGQDVLPRVQGGLLLRQELLHPAHQGHLPVPGAVLQGLLHEPGEHRQRARLRAQDPHREVRRAPREPQVQGVSGRLLHQRHLRPVHREPPQGRVLPDGQHHQLLPAQQDQRHPEQRGGPEHRVHFVLRGLLQGRQQPQVHEAHLPREQLQDHEPDHRPGMYFVRERLLPEGRRRREVPAAGGHQRQVREVPPAVRGLRDLHRPHLHQAL